MHQIDGKPAKFGYAGLFHHIGLLKTLTIGLFIVFITPFIYANSAHATQTVPYKINFQGRLTDSSGNIKPNGTYSMKFRLFSGLSGGSALWTETRDHASGQQVTVTNGLFSVQLGDVATLSPSLFSSGTYPMYLEVELPSTATATCTSNGCESWTEGAMSPRSPFGASGYAFNADQVDGIDGSSLARNDTSNTFSSGTTNTFNGQLVVNSTETVANSQILGFNIQGTTGSYTLQSGGTGGFLYSDGTNIHIGLTASGSSGGSVTPGSDTNDILVVARANANVYGIVDSGVGYGANLISNPSFEFGCSAWIACNTSTATDDPYSGQNEYKYVMSSTSSTYDINSRKIAVQPGDQLYTSVKIKTSATTTGQAGLYVQFFNASGATIGFSDGDYTNPGTSYVTKSWVHTVPAGTAYATLGLTVRGAGATTAGTWKFDDAVMYQVIRTGPAVFRNEANTAGAFQVQDAGSNPILTVDTSLNATSINAINGRTLPTLVVNQASTGDATLSLGNATNTYYLGLDATDNKFKLGASASTFTAGYSTYSASQDSGNQNRAQASLVQATGTGSVTKLRAHFGSAVAGTAQLALYADNGSKTAPGVLMSASSSVTPTANSWVDFAISSQTVTAGQYYWIAYNLSSNTTAVNYTFASDGISIGGSKTWTYGTWESPSWTGGSFASTRGWAVNMDIATGTVTDQFNSSALSIDQYGNTKIQGVANSQHIFQIQDTSGTLLFNADTAHDLVTVAKSNTDTTPTLNIYQGSTGDASLALSNSSNQYFIGIDGSDSNKLKLGSYATGSTKSGPATFQATTDTNRVGYVLATLVQAATTGTVTGINTRIGAGAAGNIQAAIYSDATTPGTRYAPDSRIASSGSVAVTANSWVSAPLSATVTAGQYYWLVIAVDNNATIMNLAAPTDGATINSYAAGTFGTWPSTWPAYISTPGFGYAVNMDVTPSPLSDQFALSPLSVTSSGQVAIKPISDLTSAFAVQNSQGNTLLNADTTNNSLKISASDRQYTDLVTIDNATNQSVANNQNALHVLYTGGVQASSEGAGLRIDSAIGAGASAIVDGLRITAANGASSGQTLYGIKLEGPTSPGSGQETAAYVGTGWDLGLDIQSGGLQLNGSATSDPSAPATDNLKIYAKNIAGRTMPTFENSTNAATPLQSSLGFSHVALSSAGSGGAGCAAALTSTIGTVPNIGKIGSAATCTIPSPATTNLMSSVRRTQYSTGTTTASSVYQDQTSSMVWRGNSAGLGGFFYTVHFGLSATSTSNYAFVGLTSDVSGSISNIDPLAVGASNHRVGMAINVNTGNWKFTTTSIGGTPSATDLGSNFAVNATDMYELAIYSAPNGSSIGYRVKNLTTGIVTSGSISSALPANTAFLAPTIWISNNTTANSTLDLVGWYLESDY
ncbi:MAG: hypothetical protein JWO07_514 [Candidatus Saccharibacteria bacterium]|nr:hypothetical protein [Candidatus Saccharibacteria bacterium]